MKKLSKTIEREAFGNAKRAGYQGKNLANEAGWRMYDEKSQQRAASPPGNPSGKANGGGGANR